MSEGLLSLATASQNGSPWIAPLFYAVDSELNFYFVSRINSIHCRQISENPNVAISIFNSEQGEGNANGIQLSGICERVSQNNWPEVISLFHSKVTGQDITPTQIKAKITEYVGNKRSIYKVKVKHLYIQDPDYFQKHRIDKRIEINIPSYAVENSMEK